MKGISEDLLKFIILNVDSVELIEVLVLLHAEPNRRWPLNEVDAVIRSSSSSVQKRLDHLMGLGIVSHSGENPITYQYMPLTAETKLICDKLIKAYHTHRVEIIELIYKKPTKEIITFSNAFRLRGGTDGDE